MKTQIREENLNYVMTFEGRLDTPASFQVKRDMQKLYDCEGHDIILDCTRLEYITSSGMRLFLDLRLEEKRYHLNPDFDSRQMAELLCISQERLARLFRNKSIYRTPEAYIDNLRTMNAMRLLRTQPNYSIAAIAEASGFNHVRTLQRRIMDVTGMTPADYRALFTRDFE